MILRDVCMVLYGFIWFYLVFHGFIWFFMVLLKYGPLNCAFFAYNCTPYMFLVSLQKPPGKNLVSELRAEICKIWIFQYQYFKRKNLGNKKGKTKYD